MAVLVSTRTEGIFALLNPLHLGRTLWRHRDLIVQLTRREIEGRYRGAYLGILWSLAHPLLMLTVYTLVFGVIFQSRWPQARSDSLADFALILFAGLSAYSCFSETVGRAAGSIVSVPNYVKKVIFPLEVLPISILGAALFHMLVSIGVLLVAHLALGGGMPWTVILLPLVSLPLIFLALGIAWFVASLGVYIRDVGQAIGIVLQVMFFLTPIFYSIEIIPEPFRTLVLLNPMAPVTENFRRVLLWGQLPSFPGTLWWILATGAVMMLGYAWFMKTRKGFADVL
jgi:lipopolysaccharide transport system permease protein